MSSALETLPLRLLQSRKSVGISQSKCAAKVGVSDRSYKLYELGRREIPLSTAIKFSEELEVDLLWLLTGRGHQTRRSHPDLVAETITVVAEKINPSITRDEAEKWGKRGELVYKLAFKNGTSARTESRDVFDAI